MDERIFVGVYPTGLCYADRKVEVAGDYKRLAFLPFRSLVLEVAADCPRILRGAIERMAASVQTRRGEQFAVSSSGQTVILGK